MSSVFPGMDPYLEYPAFWSSFHMRLMVAIAESLEPQLGSQYYVEVESRTFTFEMTERYLEVREMKTDRVITVIELLSPKNKRSGEGREAYEKKRRAILSSETHLIEIDLLRGSKPMEVRGHHSEAIYRILISRRDQRPMADFYGISLQQSLPSFPVPLQGVEVGPIVELQSVFNHVYDRARYASRIDYQQPLPPPKLSESDRVWVELLLHSKH
jgi:hypothetical protein